GRRPQRRNGTMRAEDIVDWLKSHVEPGAKLRLDSRQVQPGDAFFACSGLAGDGRDHIGAALDAGAAAVVVQAPLPEYLAPAKGRAPMLEVLGLTGLLGQTAHVWYGEPSHNLSVVAVTGTNGKTTTVQWIAAALNAAGAACGTTRPLGVTLPDCRHLGGQLTTPDRPSMQRLPA